LQSPKINIDKSDFETVIRKSISISLACITCVVRGKIKMFCVFRVLKRTNKSIRAIK